jgi:hypothetical protein
LKIYPDIKNLLEAKSEKRRKVAKLPFEEKIKIVRRLRRLNKGIKSNAIRFNGKAQEKN